MQRCASERVQSSKLRRLGLRPRARWLHGFRGLVLQPQRDHGAVNAMLGLSFDHQIISVAGETIDDALHPDRIGKCGPAIEVTIIEHSAGRKGFEKVLRKGSLGSEKRQCAGLRAFVFAAVRYGDLRKTTPCGSPPASAFRSGRTKTMSREQSSRACGRPIGLMLNIVLRATHGLGWMRKSGRISESSSGIQDGVPSTF